MFFEPLLERVIPFHVVFEIPDKILFSGGLLDHGELKRRNVFRVAAAYAVIGWLVAEVGSLAFGTFEAPAWVMKVFATFILLGFPFAEAVYAVLDGDHDAALTKLARAFEGGVSFDPNLSNSWPMFAALEGDAEYEAILGRIIDHVNSERSKMGLGPINQQSAS